MDRWYSSADTERFKAAWYCRRGDREGRPRSVTWVLLVQYLHANPPVPPTSCCNMNRAWDQNPTRILDSHMRDLAPFQISRNTFVESPQSSECSISVYSGRLVRRQLRFWHASRSRARKVLQPAPPSIISWLWCHGGLLISRFDNGFDKS